MNPVNEGTAREVIAGRLFVTDAVTDCLLRADAILAALSDAGYEFAPSEREQEAVALLAEIVGTSTAAATLCPRCGSYTSFEFAKACVRVRAFLSRDTARTGETE